MEQTNLSQLTVNQLKELKKMREAYHCFDKFVIHIFSHSIDILLNETFVGGDYVQEICEWYQTNKKTIRVSARDHMKSMSFYAHIMWKLYKLQFDCKNIAGHYFSYKESMAQYHLTKVKIAVKSNKYFKDCIDLKSTAESIISYTWNGKKKFSMHPHGLLEFKRGIHSPLIYIDDALQDPENTLVPTVINKINKIMKTQVIDMVQDEIHIVGTAQTHFDFYFDKDFTFRFAVRVDPAEKDPKNKIALWPEWQSWDELMAKKRERGERVYNQEYLCSPSYTENAYIHKDRVMERVNDKLQNYSISRWKDELRYREQRGDTSNNDFVAGWDLGKKKHPSHFVIFEKIGKKRVQRLSKWFDQVDYSVQLEYITECCDVFQVDNLYYDATRGEMEMQKEQGALPDCFEGVHFTSKAKYSIATAFDLSIERNEIELLNDLRQTGQIAIVNNDLQAPETPEGHGDSFWSIGLTFMDGDSDDVNITIL